MRRIAASLAVLAVAWLGVSSTLPAQTTGAVAGRLVDAAGEALGEVTVELLAAEAGQAVGSALQTGVTDALGSWAFSGVTPGEYVIQAVLGEAVAGVPVTVGAALSSGVVIVAPECRRGRSGRGGCRCRCGGGRGCGSRGGRCRSRRGCGGWRRRGGGRGCGSRRRRRRLDRAAGGVGCGRHRRRGGRHHHDRLPRRPELTTPASSSVRSPLPR